VDAESSSTKIILSCDKCGKRVAVGSSLAGKAAKCNCGNIIKIPQNAVGANKNTTQATSNVASKTNATVATASMPGSKASKAVAPRVPASPPTPASPAGSFLDQLTEADFKRPPSNPYAVDSSHKSNDAAILRKYAGTAEKLAEESKTADGNILFLAVLHFIGAFFQFAAGIGLLLIMGVAATLSEIMPLAAIGSLFVALLICFGIFDLVAGIGLLSRKPWGWWLCQIGLGWCVFDNVSKIGLRFMFAENWTDPIPKAVGELVFIMANLYFLNFFCKKSTMKLFKVDVHPGVLWSVALGVGLLLGGVTFGLGYSVGKAAQANIGNAGGP
jgi:hypothetical protein